MPIYPSNDILWAYSVTFTNRTPEVLDEVIIFYQESSSGSIISKVERTWAPGETRIFALGLCGDMASYNIGVFIGDDMVAKFPEQGSMTRERASVENPTDKFICEDSWSVG